MTFSPFASPGVSLQGGGGGGGGGGTPGGADTQVQFNDGGVFGGDAGLTFNKTSKTITLGGGTVTTSSPVIDAAQTWDDGAVTFTGLKFNATDTDSAAGSLLMDLQVGGASQFSVGKGGVARGVFRAPSGGTVTASMASNALSLGVNAILTWTNGDGIGTGDLILTRRAAANLRLGAADAAAPVAQTLSAQSVAAGTTNIAGANLTITGSQGTGTGAGGSIVFQVAPAGSSGTAQNALVDVLTLSGSTRGAIFHPGTFQSGGVSFAGSTANIFSRSLGIINISQANTLAVDIAYAAFSLSSDYALAWSSVAGATGASGTKDVFLLRDAANTLALRNGTNAQTFNIYNTFTNASNYERGFVRWESNALRIGTEKGGTGTDRAIEFYTAGVKRFEILANGNVQAPSFVASGNLFFGSTGQISSGRVRYSTPADGQVLFLNNASNGFDRIMLGGDTSSFPALKRSSTTLIVRLADDTANAALESASLKTDAPAGGTAAAWRLGTVASVSPTSPNRTIEVDIGGTIYYLSAKTTND